LRFHNHDLVTMTNYTGGIIFEPAKQSSTSAD